MSSIPLNYNRAYIDAKASMKSSGHVPAGQQIQSPASAGSRGLAKTTQFTNDKTQMQLGQETIAESMVEIRTILNRIDGVNAPVQEDDMQDLTISDLEAQLGKINDEITFLKIDQKDKESALAALGALRTVLDKYQSQKESAVKEDAGEDEKVVDMLRKIKQHLDNHPNMNEHPSLVALDQLADDLESGDKPADYESVSEDDGEEDKKFINFGEKFNADEWSDNKVDDHGPDLMRLAKGQPIEIPAWDSYYMDMDDGRPHNDQDGNERANDTIGGEVTSAIRGHMDDIQKADFVGKTEQFKPTAETIKYAQNIINSPEFKKAYNSTESAVQEDDESYGYEWQCSNCGTENEFVMTPQERAQYIKDWEADNQDLVADGETGENALNNLLDDTGEESGMHYGQKCMKCGTEATNPHQNESELARLKELSGIKEDTNDDLMQWAKKYSQYKNLEDDNLIEALYDFAFDLGITQFIFEVGELQAAEQKLGKKQEDWEDAEINAAMEMSPISNGLIDDLHRILPGNAELEQKLDSIRGMLEKAGLKEDKYQPMPEGDEFDIEEDEDFEEVLGSLGFPEDETDLFDAEYQGRKVPLNKPMRGDTKKFKVYVKDPKTGNVKKVNFGHGGTSAKKLGQKTMKIRKSNPKARKSFRARHNCANPGPKTKARYWSCRKW